MRLPARRDALGVEFEDLAGVKKLESFFAG